jgi:hypothetical protein
LNSIYVPGLVLFAWNHSFPTIDWRAVASSTTGTTVILQMGAQLSIHVLRAAASLHSQTQVPALPLRTCQRPCTLILFPASRRSSAGVMFPKAFQQVMRLWGSTVQEIRKSIVIYDIYFFLSYL